MAVAKKNSGRNSQIPADNLTNLFSTKEPNSGKLPRRIKRKEVISSLGKFGEMSTGLVKKMKIPDYLFKLDTDTFSSDKNIPAYLIYDEESLENCRHKNLPDYSISVGSRGSDIFCTLIDKKRGFILTASIGHMMVEEGSWDFFERWLDEALEKSDKLTGQDRKEGKIVEIIR